MKMSEMRVGPVRSGERVHGEEQHYFADTLIDIEWYSFEHHYIAFKFFFQSFE
jgi:hypothetical protein